MEKTIFCLEEINHWTAIIIRWFALAMVLLQFAIVVMRYVFGISSMFYNEGILYLHAWLFMLGAGYTLLVDKHVRVDIFYANCSEKGKAIIDICGHLFFLIPSMLMLLVFSWPSVLRSWQIREGAVSVGGIPASYLLKSLIPAFALLLVTQCVANLLKDIFILKNRKENGEGATI